MDEWETPAEVAARVKGITVAHLAQRRFQGLPPAFYKPTHKTVLYRRSDVDAWIEDSRRTITSSAAVA